MPEKTYLLDQSGGVWERTGDGIRSIAVAGLPRRGPLIARVDEVEGRYGPLVPIDSADPRIPR